MPKEEGKGRGATLRARSVRVLLLFKDAGVRWSDDNCMRLGASLAYYAVFSVFPLLLLAVTCLGFVLGESPETRRALLDAVANATTPAFKTLFDQTLDDMQKHQTARGVGAVVGAITLVFGASGVFSELQHALNVIWRVPEQEGPQFWASVLHVVRRKVLSFAVVFAAALAILVSVVLTTILSYVGERVEGVASGVVSHTALFMVIENLGSITVLTLVLASMFRLVPSAKVEWRDVLFGALVSAVLFTAIKHALSYYLARMGSYAAYGAVGGFLCLLTWIYLASLFLFYGAELARVYAERYGSLAASQASTPSGAPSPAPAPP